MFDARYFQVQYMIVLDENDFRVEMLRSILVRKIRKDRMMWKTERAGRKEGKGRHI